MILYPAIDLMNHQAVRLRKGQRDDVTVYGDPRLIARRYREQGAQWLHLVDLDAAFDGASRSLPLIAEVVEAFGGPVELGGGLRAMADIEARMALGVERCIIGTAAFTQPELVAEACARWPGRIAVGIDAKDGLAAVKGWVETTDMTAVDLALRVKAAGVGTVIYTDISRDGMMSGPNVAATARLREASGLEVIASGGVSSLEDLRRLSEAGCDGAILGKALLDGAFTLAEALEIV